MTKNLILKMNCPEAAKYAVDYLNRTSNYLVELRESEDNFEIYADIDPKTVQCGRLVAGAVGYLELLAFVHGSEIEVKKGKRLDKFA